ncbi:endonuclease domain-containing 1 protein-like [Ctenopharyngodon idella]|uniref:endonuclease domain-containing 1 protein-like n=1 Tax=Ctenopharyngodon idella TaxID=7959 RepID=UPI00222ED144|nr:endonuclease domain-containing 1 protein-like [Ctenopharyngodon idella]
MRTWNSFRVHSERFEFELLNLSVELHLCFYNPFFFIFWFVIEYVQMKMCPFVISVLLAFGLPLIMTEVVKSFSACSQFFLNEQPSVIPGILENSLSKDNRYKLICQKYKNAYRFATLYDTTNRIPVFSAYKYTEKGHFTRPNKEWMTESELDPPVAEMTVPCLNQAISADYCKNCYKVNRGHLFPCCHAADLDTAESTFTLTNVVPQKISFNAGSWKRMEEETKEIMDTCKNNNNEVLAHVLTGAIPGNNKMKKKVNIPSFMWMAFCCYNSTENAWVSQAYWAPNEEENTKVNIPKRSLLELQGFLNANWVQNVQLFENNCTL